MQLTVDADVPLVHLVEAFARCGLTLSNTGDYSFRVHRAETLAAAAAAAQPKVIFLSDRRRQDDAVDCAIRAGMRTLVDPLLPGPTES
jgi:hypothetical protein